MFQLCYISQSNINREDLVNDVDDILANARINNKLHDITGLLVYRAGWFCQYIESKDERELMELYGRICADKRHRNITTIFRQLSSEPIFDEWSMAFKNLDESEDDFFLEFMMKARDESIIAPDSIKKLLSKFYLMKSEA